MFATIDRSEADIYPFTARFIANNRPQADVDRCAKRSPFSRKADFRS